MKRKGSRCNTDNEENEENVIISEELKAEMGYDENMEDIALPSNKSKKKKKMYVNPALIKKHAQISKSQAKKIAKLKEKKEKDEARHLLYASLEKNQLSDAHLKLMRSTATLGGTQTKKERIHRTFALQQAGLHAEEADLELLYQKKTVGEMEDEESTPLETDARERVVVQVTAPIITETKVSHEALAQLLALKEKNRKRREIANTPAPPSTASILLSRYEDPDMLPYIPTQIEIEKLLQSTSSAVPTLDYRKFVVPVTRKPEIQKSRMELPICSSEQEIMESITKHNITILCGETGSGKTTQVPQFLYEAGFGSPGSVNAGMIGVTQPRRVAAVSTAKRVAQELNVLFGKTGYVGYQIRYDAKHVGANTRVKFMTDGILLKEVQTDFLLRRYSVLLLDEAHERNVNTDILIGLLSRIVPLRQKISEEQHEAWEKLSEEERKVTARPLMPLKMVIMSATLRVEDFTENKRLFPIPPPVLRVEARQFPVTIHFNKATELDDYVGAAFKKICKIHRKLPEGGILVFLTGQREIVQLCRKLKSTFTTDSTDSSTAIEWKQPSKRRNNDDDDDEIRENDDDEAAAEIEDQEKYGNDDLDEDNESSDMDEESLETLCGPVHVLPLYSLLDNDKQLKIFQTPPEGHRLIVVATNVAETSLTIPGISYVVDAGRSKERIFDKTTGVSSFNVQWTSKASADQRAGRAGRTGPGHCYRIYSSAVYDNEFVQFSDPEILCRPIEDLVLQMKSIGVDHVENFPFPTPPDAKSITTALKVLKQLGAVHAETARILPLGRLLSRFPLGPRYAKMLLLAKQGGANCLELTIAMVACLSGQSPFIRDEKDTEEDEEKKSVVQNEHDLEAEWREQEQLQKRAQWIHGESDVLGQLRAAGAYAYAGGSSTFCEDNFLHDKIMQQALQLRHQLTRIVNQMFLSDADFTPIHVQTCMDPPSSGMEAYLRQILAAGFLDQVARRAPKGSIVEGSKMERSCGYLSCHGDLKEVLYIHPHSHVFTTDVSSLPEFIVYATIIRTAQPYMKSVTAIDKSWLVSIARGTPLCHLSSPLETPLPKFDIPRDVLECSVQAHYGDAHWALPTTRIPYPIDAKRVYRWFARLLLQGDIIPSFTCLKSHYVESPASLTKKKHDKKIQLLLAPLETHTISTKSALLTMWKKDPSFLQHALQLWIPKKAYPLLLQICQNAE